MVPLGTCFHRAGLLQEREFAKEIARNETIDKLMESVSDVCLIDYPS
jgi:hypothetical protein